MTFPNDFLDLLNDETKALLYLATIMVDGSPQVTPVWFSTDGKHILINTNEGRTKDKNMKARPKVAMTIQDPKNMKARPKVAMTIQDPKNPDRYLGMRGEVIGFTKEGADEHINQLSLKYYERPWKYREGQRRIIYRIKPVYFDPHSD